jgi:DNA-binding transcriptional MocR family regulator
MTELFGFELIYIPMHDDGPDMDLVEEYIKDPTVKGIWCVPKYANPTGITYTDDMVRRIAKMKPAAPDFMVIWDNAYAVHDFVEEGDHLLDIFVEAEKWGNEDMIYYYSSTSKITFAGSGVAMMAASTHNIKYLEPHYGARTIGPDKLNQLRHLYFVPNVDVLRAQMKKHGDIVFPRFEMLLATLERELAGKGIATWTNPKGGYFVSLDVMEGCAKRVYALCKEAGVVLTTVGATFPYGNDPKDSNLRLAPTFCKMEELGPASAILACSIKIAALEKLLEN